MKEKIEEILSHETTESDVTWMRENDITFYRYANVVEVYKGCERIGKKIGEKIKWNI